MRVKDQYTEVPILGGAVAAIGTFVLLNNDLDNFHFAVLYFVVFGYPAFIGGTILAAVTANQPPKLNGSISLSRWKMLNTSINNGLQSE